MINEIPNHPHSYNFDPEEFRAQQAIPPGYRPDGYDEPPTKLEMAIGLFQKLGTSEAVGTVHPISIRVPTMEFTSIQAMAKHAGLSVNKVVIELLQVALDEVWQGLNEENRNALFAIRNELITGLFTPDGEMKAEVSKKGEI